MPLTACLFRTYFVKKKLVQKVTIFHWISSWGLAQVSIADNQKAMTLIVNLGKIHPHPTQQVSTFSTDFIYTYQSNDCCKLKCLICDKYRYKYFKIDFNKNSLSHLYKKNNWNRIDSCTANKILSWKKVKQTVNINDIFYGSESKTCLLSVPKSVGKVNSFATF